MTSSRPRAATSTESGAVVPLQALTTRARSTGTLNLQGRPAIRRAVMLLLAVLLSAIAQGCASVRERNPVPEELIDAVQIPGLPYVRFWGDELPPDLEERLAQMRARVEAGEFEGRSRSGIYLAISGGGANGAFGAGLLIGWTEAGDRPEFDIVTGVSTGALTAPFAFLGSEYDRQLREIYTTISTADVLERRGTLAALTGDAMASSDPLKKLIAKYFDEELMRAIAAEFEKVRVLLVATTNLDAARPVVWNISRIAASGAPNALELIRSVLLASASIPGAFPPVYVEVEASGRRYDEMHVDGSAASQVFLYPAALDSRRIVEALGFEGRQRVYVVRNSLLMPRWSAVEPKLLPIVGQSIDTLIKMQGIGDLYRIFLGAQRDGMEFYLAHIPRDFEDVPKEPFDQEYMQKLFDLGYNLARSGYRWDRAPPGMTPP